MFPFTKGFSAACLGWIVVVAGEVHAQSAIPLEQARALFARAERMCAADDGQLWGVRLSGPIMFVDPKSRAFVASQRDSSGLASEQDGVFVGTLPGDQNIANTAFHWAGVHWTQIIWPPPDSLPAADVLMAHELFHGAQQKLGIRGGNPPNAHLDGAAARTLMQLEWRALASAIATTDSGMRRSAIGDALAFRAARRQLAASAATDERDLERIEGLAEYTGMTLALRTRTERAALVGRNIGRQVEAPTFVRGFAYASGPAYGLLLDDTQQPWREKARRGEDVGDLLAAAEHVRAPAADSSAVAARARRYDGPALKAGEEARAKAKQAVIDGYRAQLVDGPTLRIPLRKMNIQFDPRNQQPLGTAGTVYPTLRVTDVWGILTVFRGALVSADWTSVSVSAPKDGGTTGDGWLLELKPGWKLAMGMKLGSYVLTPQSRP